MVNESASTSILTLRDIRIIKQRNPTEALRKLQHILCLSTDAPLPSSTIVAPSELHDEVVFILQQLNTTLFESDFLCTLEKGGELSCDIFKFLDSLSLHDLPTSMAKYFVEFEAFFTQLVKDLKL